MAVIFETARLTVRDFTLDDFEDAWAIYGDPEVSRWLGGMLVNETREDTRAMLEWITSWRRTDGMGIWAVVENASGRLIGGAELMPAHIGGADHVEVGYHFRQDAWGQGYATELARGIVRHAFEVLELRRLVGVYLPGNDASGRVLRKVGMQDVGMTDYNGTAMHMLAIDRPAAT